VLLTLVLLVARNAAAQAPSATAEPSAIPNASPPAAATPPSPPPPPPAAAPSTPVDAPTPTTGHTPPRTPAPAPAPYSVPPEFLPGRAPPRTPGNAPRFRDAHHDHVLVLPTGETHPKGTFYVSDLEIVLLQLGYAVSDTTQITFSGAPPLGAELVVPLDLSLKSVVLREPTVSVALLGSASGVIGGGEFNGFVGRAGGAVTLCQPAWLCTASLTFASNVALVGPGSIVLTGVGAVYRVSDLVALLAEVDTAVPLGPEVGEFNGIGVGAGVRFSGRGAGLDLGLFQLGKAGEPRPPLLPFIAATWRTH
jgi:hypothetical protein